jgi:hypothetical protein
MPAWGPGGHIANYDLEDIQESATLAHLTSNNAHGYLFINDCTLPPDLHNCVGHGDARSLADEKDEDVSKEWADAIRPYMTD